MNHLTNVVLRAEGLDDHELHGRLHRLSARRDATPWRVRRSMNKAAAMDTAATKGKVSNSEVTGGRRMMRMRQTMPPMCRAKAAKAVMVAAW
jgi:hypothetical protein